MHSRDPPPFTASLVAINTTCTSVPGPVHLLSGRDTRVLLCLLWSLVVVHSQTEYPYVSFIGGDTIALPNHAFANLSLVGEVGSHSVRCDTDLDTCCGEAQGIHRGDWIPPDSEESLPSEDTSADIYQVQLPQRVIIRRRNNANMPSGIYRCRIATNAVHDDDDTSVGESVYVGLYASGGKTFLSFINYYYNIMNITRITSLCRRYHIFQ